MFIFGDRIHAFQAKFYDEEIEDAYSEFSTMINIISFLSLLAISIASMGLFGMVVFTTETRLKEISVRKVMGATPGSLNLLTQSRVPDIAVGMSDIFFSPPPHPDLR